MAFKKGNRNWSAGTKYPCRIKIVPIGIGCSLLESMDKVKYSNKYAGQEGICGIDDDGDKWILLDSQKLVKGSEVFWIPK